VGRDPLHREALGCTAVVSSVGGPPGAELVEEGLSDLAAGREPVPARLVSIGAPRLRRLGFEAEARVCFTGEPPVRLRGFVETVADRLDRYPAVDPASFRRALEELLSFL
jgi:hypothetical protein